MSVGRRSAPPGAILRHPSQPLVSRGPSEKTTAGKTPEEIKDHLQSQLNAVEKLQYQLTAHELQFAQRMAQKEQQAAEQIKVTVVSSSSDSNEGEGDCLCSKHVIFSNDVDVNLTHSKPQGDKWHKNY